jgi:hypothetical protein
MNKGWEVAILPLGGTERAIEHFGLTMAKPLLPRFILSCQQSSVLIITGKK